MPDEFELSRRKVLGAVGGIGIASAGAGLGTTAYFNDTESFQGNSMTAGELDLKVDWEEHYSYPQLYGKDDPADGLDVTRTTPTDTTNYVGLPDPNDPVVWVHEDDLGDYMANTSIEAFPDPNNDGHQEVESDGFTYEPCNDGADLPGDLDDFSGDARRTKNDDTYDDDAGEYEPLVNLTDVKPGDFGELTLSFHLCDNPGYVWLQAANVIESAGMNTEPEGDTTADLAENIETVWWYDARGDNVFRNCEETIYLIENSGNASAGDGKTPAGTGTSFLFEVELSGSVANLVDLYELPERIEAGHIAATPDGEEIYIIDRDTGNLAVYDVDSETFSDPGQISNHPGEVVLFTFAPDGTLYMADNNTDDLYTVDLSTSPPTANTVGGTGIDVQGADLATAVGGGLFLYSNTDESLYTVDTSTGTATLVGEVGENLTGLAVRDAGQGPLLGSSTSSDEIIEISKTDGSVLNRFPMKRDDSPYEYDFGDMTTGELCGQVFRRGTLASDLDALKSGDGIPLDGDRATSFVEESGDPTSGDRECFLPGLTHYIGFGWWIPAKVGNEIQDDSVSFDLGFYTEQCRHNDGSGSNSS